MNAELHLIVLWANARYKEKEILEDIAQNLLIKNVFEIEWSKEKVADNFSRFYGKKLPDKSYKEKECGTDPFLCVIVEDKEPQYDYVETSRGHEIANLKLFGLKEKYRSWTRGGHKIHTTNSVEETNHDSALLLGLNYKDLQKENTQAWDGHIKTLKRNLTGTNGWKDLSELFYTLNATTEYIVMRGYENLEETIMNTDHGDIDILVSDYTNAVFIVGGIPCISKDRPHYETKISGKNVYIDLWNIKSVYRDKRWDKEIFATHTYYNNLISVPNLENYFYMMVYHCLINKKTIAKDYYDLMHNLFIKLGLDKKYKIEDYETPFDLYFELLEKFMMEHGYEYVRPKDKSVFYSDKFVALDKLREYLKDNYNIISVNPLHSDLISGTFNIFLKGVTKDNQKLFIKSGDMNGLYRNEYHNAKELYDLDSNYFIKPFYYHDDESGFNFVATEYIKAQTLEEIIEGKNVSLSEKQKYIEDLYEIFKVLKNSNVVHRDINPKNLVISEGKLKLIDFQMAVTKNKYRELGYMKRNIWLLSCLGREFAYGRLMWDDNYSLLKVLEYIGCNDKYKEVYDKIYSEIKSCVGQNIISFVKKKNRNKYRLKLLCCRIKLLFCLSNKKRKIYKDKKKELKILVNSYPNS